MCDATKNQIYLTMDNDSGYASNTADSNANSILENSLEQPQHIFISEDALLEKPEVREQSIILETSGEEDPGEYSHLFYISRFEDEIKSDASELSSIITPIKSIETTASRLNSLLKVACSSKKKKLISTPNINANSFSNSEANEYFILDEHLCQNLQLEDSTNKFLGFNTLNFEGIIQEKTKVLSGSNNLIVYENIVENCTIVNSELMDSLAVSASENCVKQNELSEHNDRELVSEICTGLLNNSMLEGPLLDGEEKATSKKENVLVSSHTTPDKNGKRKRDETMSPDLFSDEESCQDNDYYNNSALLTQTKAQDEKYINRNDKRLLRRVREGVSGRLPPPGLSLSISEMLDKINKNEEYFVSQADVDKRRELDQSNTSINSDTHQDTASGSFSIDNRKKTLLVTTDLENCLSLKWPLVLEERYHGLHYNRGKVSEEFELLCAKYGQRFVGQETLSTCTVFTAINVSPRKRASSKTKWTVKSPGRRLSHLAKRRITFSSAYLQAGSSVMSAHARQILVDSRKMQMLAKRKSPRKTPKKTPKRSPRKRIRTPSSSVKKQMAKSLNLFTEDEQLVVKPSTSANKVHATKRALFQSPESKAGPSSKLILPSTSGNASVSPFVKKSTPKRTLFLSPKKSPKRTPHKRNLFDTKRKRRESADELHPAKIARKLSVASSTDSENQLIPPASKSFSSLSIPAHHVGELSAHHKKKLQWAVYEALKSQSIGVSNPDFKQFASTLARVTRRFLPNLSANAPRPEGGTSDRMLRIARQHVYAVVKGKTVDEIVQEVNKNKLKMMKPTGYISAQQEKAMKKEMQMTKKDTVLQDKANVLNSMDKTKTNNELTNTKLPRFENRVDRVRKVINFDDDNR